MTSDLTKSHSQHIKKLQNSYEEVMAAEGLDAVILHSGRELKKLDVDDQYWPISITPSFSQWLPFVDANNIVVVQKGKKPTLIRPKTSSFWEGPPPQPDSQFADGHFAAAFNLVECEPEAVSKALPGGNRAWIGESKEAAVDLGFDPKMVNPPSLVEKLDAQRVIKSDYEVQCLSKASVTAARGHSHLAKLFASGHHSELDLHLEYLRVTQQNATETPYGNIVAQGTNAAVLHHLHYTKHKDSSENLSLLVDAGATFMGYASDITRTHVRGESPEARDFRALLAGMEALQLSLCTQVVPGLDYEELHNSAHRLLAALLLETGIATGGSAESLVEAGITRAFFPHGLGHSLGLQVHDVGCRLVPPADNNPFLRNTSKICPGQVFTVEPGCYFIDGLLGPLRASASTSKYVSWPTVDSLRQFGGIRIEDNLLVTDSASVNLTRDSWPS